MSEAANKAIILFDGVCNFCNSTINFIIEHDSQARFKFAPLQSEIGEQLLAKYHIDKTLTDSIILIEEDKAYTHSTAALHVAKHLSGAWSWIYFFRIIPQSIRDFAYKIFARNRYKLFGKQEACMIPTPEVRARFLTTN